MPTDAQTLFDSLYGNIGTLRSSLQDSITELATFAGSPQTWFDFSGMASPELAEIGGLSEFLAPVLAPQNLTLTAPTARTRMDFTTALPQIQKPVLGVSDSAQVDTAAFDVLQGQLDALIQSGGAGISPEVQAAIFATGSERNLQILQDGLDLAGARTGAKGFRYPNSMTKAAEQEVIRNFVNQREDLNREIIKTMGAIAQQVMTEALRAKVSVASALADVSVKNLTYLLEAKRAVLEEFRVSQEANLAEFEGQLKALLATVEIEVENEKLELAQVSALREQLQLEGTLNLAAFDGELRGKLAVLDAEKTARSLQVTVQDQVLRQWQTESSQIVEKGKAIIQQAEHANALRLSAVDSVARGYGDLVKNMAAQGVTIVTKKT